MAKKIIVLNTSSMESAGNAQNRVVNAIFWVDVPVARVSSYANASLVSAYKDASAAENLALQTGSVTEKSFTKEYPVGTTLNSIKTDLEAELVKFQAFTNDYNPGKFFGSFFDGTTWTTQGTA